MAALLVGNYFNNVSILFEIHMGKITHPSTALCPYCGCALGLAYMLKQLLSSSLMEVMKPGSPGNVDSGETSLS